ncbi:hypothetical protein ACFQ2X_05565 [Microbulbifer celer]|uniref:Uncharacterized protein n=1 Tax=Microbulbifer celer TaxID=435905 RepID=A0ABW3U6B3_9GAMM
MFGFLCLHAFYPRPTVRIR